MGRCTVSSEFKTQFIIAGIEEGREHYLSFAKSTPNKTFVWWTDFKDDAFDFESLENAQTALIHMALPIPNLIVVRQCLD
jgi:hypothetical protein